MFFKPRPIISPEDMHWQHETYKWLAQNFPKHIDADYIPLVTPSRECFPDVGNTMEERVSQLFLNVRRLAGMEAWPCVLEAQQEDPNIHIAPTLLIKNAPQGPSGTFRIDEQNRVIISFNVKLIDDAWAMVATFAHELAHYLTCTAKEPPPGGWENWEFATDLAAVYLGFGLFLANTSFSFQQFVDYQSNTQGWRTKNQGYLSENELLHALAIFILLHNEDEHKPLKYLKDSLKGRYKKVLKYIKSENIVSELQAVRGAAMRNLEEQGASDHTETTATC